MLYSYIDFMGINKTVCVSLCIYDVLRWSVHGGWTIYDRGEYYFFMAQGHSVAQGSRIIQSAISNFHFVECSCFWGALVFR